MNFFKTPANLCDKTCKGDSLALLAPATETALSYAPTRSTGNIWFPGWTHSPNLRLYILEVTHMHLSSPMCFKILFIVSLEVMGAYSIWCGSGPTEFLWDAPTLLTASHCAHLRLRRLSGRVAPLKSWSETARQPDGQAVPFEPCEHWIPKKILATLSQTTCLRRVITCQKGLWNKKQIIKPLSQLSPSPP